MEYDLSILTEKQREAWKLHVMGLNYKQIAEKMGISVSAATNHIHRAERRFREWEAYNATEQKKNETVHIIFTRGEIEILLRAVSEYEHCLRKQAHYNIKTDWKGRLPYECRILPPLSAKMQMALYGDIRQESLFTVLDVWDEQSEGQGDEIGKNIIQFPSLNDNQGSKE